MKEFNLSEKVGGFITETELGYGEDGHLLTVKDVKEFIKRLKEKLSFMMNNSDYDEDSIMYVIDKLAGEKLTAQEESE